MKTSYLFSFGLVLCSISASVAQLKPQPAPERVVTDEYHGVKLEDPYRYLENLKDPEVADWMKSNANYAKAKLNEIPERQNIIKKLNLLDTKTESSVTIIKITENDHYFYLKRNANEENGKLYHRVGYKGTEKLLFDPDMYKKGTGLKYDINNIYPTENGDKVAFKIAANGSESSELLIIDKNGKQYPEIIELVGNGIVSWLPDQNSFTYRRFNSADITDVNRRLNTKVYHHKLGDDYKKDAELFSNTTNPELNIASEEQPHNYCHKNSNKYYGLVGTIDKRIILYHSKISENYKPEKWEPLVSKNDEISDFNFGKEYIYYLTFKNASNYKILKAPYSNPSIKNAVTVVEEPKNGSITDYRVTKDGLYYAVTEYGIQAKVYFLANGKSVPTELELPFQAGSAHLSTINENKSEVWVTLSGWTSPTKRYLYNPSDNTFTFQPLTKPIDFPEFKNIVSKEIMIPSHDGVMVPVSLIYDKNIKLDGNNPVLLIGYGAYGISITPEFSPEFVLNYVSYGGIFVFSHVRGGGELGDKWHKAGYKITKPNTWKDIIATAEYLVREKISSPEKIAICGGSAGGILVGRAMTERPDLFAAAIPQVGVMNPIRMEITPNGPVNVPEFGTVKDKIEFRALLEMDSFHHIKKGIAYPATLITAGMNDPRVIAWQPAKFAAKLQNANASNNPILFYTDFESGHGIGDSNTTYFESIADVLSFAYQHTGHPKFKPSKQISKN
ncbi:prolyl oligopeptidase family serine peptidase [Flavobacterium saliperosum]|uniref:prolyl oligopeptidase n=1 Tax=Flavobacterium saliperosum TaxID=329186 RepID=A0A1G4VD30_9FLAO|nr:oligopeptidase B . Serine peptidase. MEROPS family S09A [Flavobacterium saliperosum]